MADTELVSTTKALSGLSLSPAERTGASGETKVATTDIIVKYLPIGFTEDRFHALFERFGKIKSCKLVKDRVNGQSLGYGFIKFETVESAARAAAEMNEYKLENKTITVTVARLISVQQESIAKGNVYVAGLPPVYTRETLELLFSPFGKILESRILSDHKGVSRGIGFVRFAEVDSATRALNTWNNTVPPNGTEPLTVKYARDSPGERHLRPPIVINAVPAAVQPTYSPVIYSPVHSRTICTSPLPATFVTANVVPPTLAAAPAPTFTIAPPATAGSTRFIDRNGVLTYGYPVSPTWVTTLTAGYPAQVVAYGSPVEPSSPVGSPRPVTGPGIRPGVCLFVFHIPADLKEDALIAIFSTCGTVVSAKIATDAQGGSRGFGFINMATLHEAEMAIRRLDGVQVGSKFLKVSLKTRKQIVDLAGRR